MTMIITDNIERIDLKMQKMIKSADNTEIPIPEKSNISLIYDTTIISRTEVEKMIKNNTFKNSKCILILPSSEADKFKTVFSTISNVKL